MITEIICLKCNHVFTHSAVERQTVLSVGISECDQNLSSQYIIKHLDAWNEIDRVYLSGCKNGDKLVNQFSRAIFSTRNKIIVLELKKYLYYPLENRFRKIDQTFNKNFVSKIVNIQGKKYLVVSAIVHHGEAVQEGHYTNILREENQWCEVSDLRLNRV